MAYGLLKGKKGIIFGALNDQSIAWKTAEKAFEEGAELVLTNAPIALRMGTLDALAEKTKAKIIGADATSTVEIESLLNQSIEHFEGKIDFILHAVGMSPNVRKNRPYGEMNYDWYLKTLDVSALSLHKILQSCEKLDAINEYGSVVALSYIAAQRSFPRYNDMAEAKAMLESIARTYGYRYGKLRNVRVNTVSQSPTPTTAGQGIDGFDAFLTFSERMSALGNATAEDCADYCVTLFSDLTRKVTMQNLFHDGGFSSTGITEEIIENLTGRKFDLI